MRIHLDEALDQPQQSEPISPIFNHLSAPNLHIPLQNGHEVALPIGQRNFTIHFTAPNMAYPDRVQFRYQLLPVTSGWVQASQHREAIFTNIPHGQHTLYVVAEQYDGTVHQTSLQLYIPAFFHETLWFRLLMVVVAVTFLFLLYRLRIHQVRERERELERNVQQQTQALRNQKQQLEEKTILLRNQTEVLQSQTLQLQHQTAQLQQAAEEKNRFFTGITHELKTPLALILGPLDDAIYAEDAIPKLRQYAQIMRRNGYRLKHLIDQILDVSKLNADAIHLTCEPVAVGDLTRHIVGQYQSLLDQRDVQVVLQIPDNLPYVLTDVDAWERILINLISNAITFSPEKGRIELHLHEDEEDVILSVADEGPGIPLDKQERIFEYLYQVDPSQAAGGTGIGLYLVKGLVEKMNGSISVQSEPGAGTRFILKFPAVPRAAITNPVNKQPTHPFGSLKSRSNALITDDHSDKAKPVLMLVEDNPDFRTYLTASLSEEYHVHTSKNGAEALKKIRSVRPDLVISDVMMPNMNGFEFIAALRKDVDFQHIPVVFLTARDQDADQVQGLSTGADLYLTKPIRMELLRSQIKAVLRREARLRTGQYANPSVDSTPKGMPPMKQQVHELIVRHMANPQLSADTIAEQLFMSRSKLYRKWKEFSEESFKEYLIRLRMEEARYLIESSGFSIQQAARATGYTDTNYFSTSFRKFHGVSPSQIKP